MASVQWWRIKDQNLALAAREAGFDLAVYDDYSETVRKSLKSHAIKNAMGNLLDDFEDVSGGKCLKDVVEGVYVICLSYPFTISYDKSYSEIVYIGRGSISTRLKSHYERSLFRLMRSLGGSNFDFYLSEPKGHDPIYFKHLEYALLEKFKEKIGGLRYPILNKNAGSDQNLTSLGAGWDKPLKQSGKRPIWALEQTKFWDLELLD